MQFRYGPISVLLACAALVAFAQTAPAQDYPSRPVTLVVPYPAGGGLDVLARQLGQKLADRLGKPVVIENRTGAGTVIGAASVAKAAPDGYTIMLGTSTPFAITATLNKSLPYDQPRISRRSRSPRTRRSCCWCTPRNPCSRSPTSLRWRSRSRGNSPTVRPGPARRSI